MSHATTRRPTPEYDIESYGTHFYDHPDLAGVFYADADPLGVADDHDGPRCQQCNTPIYPGQGMCDACLYPDDNDEWPQEDTDAIVGPLRIDHAAIDAWLNSHSAADPLVCDDVPY